MAKSITLGVIADSHVPDRVPALHPQVRPVFRSAAVDAILHAGDVSVPGILTELAEEAPVYAVRGNRDRWSLRHLPLERNLAFGGVPVGMLHGHGSLIRYALEYLVSRARGGLPFTYFLDRVRSAHPGARVVVFGHLHRPFNQWEGERLLFNPGAASVQISPNIPPSVGLLHLGAGGLVRGEIVFLDSG